MSDGPSCDHGLDAGAYVLGALEPEESARFAKHLEDCAACREEVAQLQMSVEGLARDLPQMPMPADLRDRITRQVQAEAELLRAAGPAADRPPHRRSRRRPRLALVAATLAAACGAAVGGAFLGSINNGHSQTISAQVAPSAPGGSAELIRSAGRAELVVRGLPQPPRGHIYEVWLARGGTSPQPTDALFSVDRAGRASVDVPGNLRGVRRVMVTAEPFGGSRRPTSAPLIIVST